MVREAGTAQGGLTRESHAWYARTCLFRVSEPVPHVGTSLLVGEPCTCRRCHARFVIGKTGEFFHYGDGRSGGICNRCLNQRTPHEKAEGRCEICCFVPERGLVMDHNHETGDFRGVLCHNCNSALGLFGDNPDVLRKAADYLDDRGHYGLI